MSEPTYRIELSHHPENGIDVSWRAAIYSTAEFDADSQFHHTMHDVFRATREDAFDVAQAWCKAKAQEPLAPSTVFLTEDGELLDPFDTVQT